MSTATCLEVYSDTSGDVTCPRGQQSTRRWAKITSHTCLLQFSLFHFSPLGLSNVTFRDESSILHYQSNRKVQRSLTNVSLRFRTRDSTATLLHAQRGAAYLTVSLLDSHLVMALPADRGQDSPEVTAQSQHPLSDGQWHTVELSIENQTIPISSWIMTVDGSKTYVNTTVKDLDFLKEGADIFVGGLSLDTGVRLSGCLGPIEIEGLLLPFYLDTELKFPRPQEEQFARVNSDTVLQYGCFGASVCAPSPCRNNGVCEDLFDMHRCSCASQWTGPMCEEMTDACLSSPCDFGNCTNLPGGFRCSCDLGYSGDLCEVSVDPCKNSNCSNGATCLKGFLIYTCLCPQNLTGQYCE